MKLYQVYYGVEQVAEFWADWLRIVDGKTQIGIKDRVVAVVPDTYFVAEITNRNYLSEIIKCDKEDFSEIIDEIRCGIKNGKINPMFKWTPIVVNDKEYYIIEKDETYEDEINY